MGSTLKGVEFKNFTDEKAELYFYGDIVSDSWGAWEQEDQYPDAVKNLLKDVEGKDLDVFINSGGGSVFAGIAIYNMLRRHAEKNKVKVHVDGLAGSIASVIAFAGSEPPEIPKNAFLMIHKPWTGLYGNAKDFRKMADDLDKIEGGILKAYEDHLKEGVEIETIKKLVDEETWLNGEEAAESFEVEMTEAEEYAAATSDYVLKVCGKIPEQFKAKPKNAQQLQIDKEQKEKRDRIKQMMIAGLTEE